MPQDIREYIPPLYSLKILHNNRLNILWTTVVANLNCRTNSTLADFAAKPADKNLTL